MKTYQHKTNNEMMFDKLRNITFELDQIENTLYRWDTYSEYGAILESLHNASVILFDDVYIALREQLGYRKTEY